MPAVTFDICALLIERSARNRFDAAIGNGKVDATAREALAVMQTVGVDNLRPQLVRTLALHFLAGETDQFVRVLRLGAKSLREDPARLKQEMHEHLQFVQASSRLKKLIGTVMTNIGPFRELQNVQVTYAGDRRKNLPGFSVSDLETTRVNSKKLTNWIVNEEQADR